MANAKLQAAQDLKKLSIQLRGILALGDELEKCGSLEQAIAEASSQLGSIQDNHRAALKALEATRAAVESGLQEAVKTSADAASFAEDIRETARCAASDVVAGATAQAEKLMAGAKAAADEIDSKTQGARKALALIEASIADRTAYLEGLEREIAQVKQTVASL